MAQVGGAEIGNCVAQLIKFGEGWLGKEATVGVVLLNIAAFGAVTEYIMLMTAFVRLRNCPPATKRPCVSPLGFAGTTPAAVIALITHYVPLLNPDYRPCDHGCTVWNAAGLLCFCLNGSKNLAHWPEEEFAVEHSTPADG